MILGATVPAAPAPGNLGNRPPTEVGPKQRIWEPGCPPKSARSFRRRFQSPLLCGPRGPVQDECRALRNGGGAIHGR
eukprot:6204293-Pyramimonas_sp.AAC.1